METSAVTVGADAKGTGKFVRLLDPEGHRIELWQHLADGSTSHNAPQSQACCRQQFRHRHPAAARDLIESSSPVIRMS